MIQVTQSPLLQALGYAIVNSLWQFALLWLVYMLVNSFIKLTSHQRYVTAVMLQFIGFSWFMGTVVFYYGESAKNIAAGFQFAQYSAVADSGSSLSFKEMFFSLVLRAESLLPYLSLAYLILITCFTVKIVKAYRHTQVLRSEGLQKIDVNCRLFVKQISSQLGIKQSIQIYISSLIQSPVTIGYLKPIILLPIAVVNNLSTKQIEAILIHEMAHIKRYDYIFNILISIIEVSLFFNPFMQLISKQLKRERENSCDDWVLQYEYNACTYAKALLQIATYRTNNIPSFAVNAVENKRALLIRVKRMIEKKDLYQTYRQQIASLLFITLLISCLAWFTPKQYKDNRRLVNSAQLTRPAKSIIEKVENPFFSPVFFLADEKPETLVGTTPPIQDEKTTALPIKKEKLVEVVATKQIESEIAEQLTHAKLPREAEESRPYYTIQNVVLDSSLFKNFATRTIIASEIKKLKTEFEKLNNSSLFQNVDWNQFWDNTRVQKQLEAAFEQLKALELQYKSKQLYAASAGKQLLARDVENLKKAEKDLKIVAGKKLTTIVNARIQEIKHLKSATKIAADWNFNFDLPDYSQLNTKDVEPYSYSYTEKPRGALTITLTAPPLPCKEPQECKLLHLTEKPNVIASEQQLFQGHFKAAPRTRMLKTVRI